MDFLNKAQSPSPDSRDFHHSLSHQSCNTSSPLDLLDGYQTFNKTLKCITSSTFHQTVSRTPAVTHNCDTAPPPSSPAVLTVPLPPAYRLQVLRLPSIHFYFPYSQLLRLFPSTPSPSSSQLESILKFVPCKVFKREKCPATFDAIME